MGPEQIPPLQVRVDLGVKASEGRASIFPKAPGQEPHLQMQFSFISRTLV